MESLYQKVKEKENVRENLILIRKKIKENGDARLLAEAMEDRGDTIADLLTHEDPKVRKNAALILGELKEDRFLPRIYNAYEKEQTLFIRSDYLKAMAALEYEPYQEELEERLSFLSKEEPAPENQKHIREETEMLKKMLLALQKREKHKFSAFDLPQDVILITNQSYREATARQVQEGKVTLIPSGVRIRQANLKKLLDIRTYRELLFPIETAGPVSCEPQEAACQLADSGLLDFFRTIHKSQGPFYIRISMAGQIPLDKRGGFIKNCGYMLERKTQGSLVATPSDYEAELRLVQQPDGSFRPLVKLFTLEDKRFSYRKGTIAASIHPSLAALAAILAKPYLKESAQVLDPFCGVGTMLIERNAAVSAKTMYGIDTFGEAIEKARENTALAGLNIYYIHRDFFDFTHEYLFDEIFTNMPLRGRKTREEHDMMYGRFFAKAEELLKRDGIIVMYCNEKGFVKKQLRLNAQYVLLQEFCLQEKEEFYLFIIARKG